MLTLVCCAVFGVWVGWLARRESKRMRPRPWFEADVRRRQVEREETESAKNRWQH